MLLVFMSNGLLRQFYWVSSTYVFLEKYLVLSYLNVYKPRHFDYEIWKKKKKNDHKDYKYKVHLIHISAVKRLINIKTTEIQI